MTDVKLRTDQGKAVVQGKTSVPFKTFVTLILQRKVFALFKKWGEEPVVIESDLLTSLASAPQDSQENRAHLVLVTLGVGVLVGVFCMSLGLAILEIFGFVLSKREFFIIAGLLLLLTLLTSILSKIQRRSRAEKITESMEKVASLLSK